MSETTTMADADARRALNNELARFHCRVAQPDDPPLFTREPRPAEQTVHWRWSDLAPLLDRIAPEDCSALERAAEAIVAALPEDALSALTTCRFCDERRCAGCPMEVFGLLAPAGNP